MIEALRSAAVRLATNVRQAEDRRAQAARAFAAALRARPAPAAAIPVPSAPPVPLPARAKLPPRPPAPAAGPTANAAALDVRLLFASPQSLAAAFIAAEILAKPVALREP